jgi:hypothetical protein
MKYTMARGKYNKDSLGNIKLKRYSPTLIGMCEAQADALVDGSTYAAQCAENIRQMKDSGEIEFTVPQTEAQQEAINAALELVEAAQKLKEAQEAYDRTLTNLRYWQVSAAGGTDYWEG